MRLVLDEMFPPAIAVALRDRGHDVIAVVEGSSLRGLSDEELFAWAQDCRRTLVTENVKDNVPIDRRFQARGEDHHGLIMTSHKTFPRHRQRFIGAVVDALNVLLEENPDCRSIVHWL